MLLSKLQNKPNFLHGSASDRLMLGVGGFRSLLKTGMRAVHGPVGDPVVVARPSRTNGGWPRNPYPTENCAAFLRRGREDSENFLTTDFHTLRLIIFADEERVSENAAYANHHAGRSGPWLRY
jgi:hypothetical protein